MAVHTKKLVAVSPAGAGLAVVYTVPSGETTIVKTLRIFNASAANRTVIVRATSTSPGTVSVDLVPATVLAAGAVLAVNDLWHVLAAGDQISYDAGGSNCRIWVSGTELEGVAD